MAAVPDGADVPAADRSAEAGDGLAVAPGDGGVGRGPGPGLVRDADLIGEPVVEGCGPQLLHHALVVGESGDGGALGPAAPVDADDVQAGL